METIQAALTGSEKKGLTSLSLRLIAWIALALDAFAISGLGKPWMASARWIAYPLFAFLLAEGVERSSSLRLYGRRLVLFAVLSEIPYDLLRFSSPLDWRSQSPMLTLLIGFFCLVLIEKLRTRYGNLVITGAAELGLAILGSRLAESLHAFFGLYGVPLIILLYLARHLTYTRLFEVAAALIFLLNITDASFFTVVISGLQYAVPMQVTLLLALALTWLYNGERGPNEIRLRTGFYLYYPLLMLLVVGIRALLR